MAIAKPFNRDLFHSIAVNIKVPCGNISSTQLICTTIDDDILQEMDYILLYVDNFQHGSMFPWAIVSHLQKYKCEAAREEKLGTSSIIP